MTKKVISPEEGEELDRLYRSHAEATAKARSALARYGIESQEFAQADKEAGEHWQSIRKLLGDDGTPWMA